MVLAILLSALSMVRRNTLDFELSVTPVECIRSLRTLCEEKGWKLERHEGSRLVDRFAIIMPMAQTARTLGLRVLDGPLTGLELTTWSEVRGSAGAVHLTILDSPRWSRASSNSTSLTTLGFSFTEMPMEMDLWRTIKDRISSSNMEKITQVVYFIRLQYSKECMAIRSTCSMVIQQ